MSFLKLEASDTSVHIEAGGTVEELVAGWAAATLRLEKLLRKRGVSNPGEMLREALSVAENRRKGNTNG